MQNIILILFFAFFAGSYLLAANEDSISAEIRMVLAGHWIGHSSDKTTVLYEFNADGSLTWFVDEDEFAQIAPNGLMAKYEIYAGDPYWEIDIFDFEHPALEKIRFYGIIDVLASGKFRMEGSKPPEEIRPEEFSEEAIMFQPASSQERKSIKNREG